MLPKEFHTPATETEAQEIIEKLDTSGSPDIAVGATPMQTSMAASSPSVDSHHAPDISSDIMLEPDVDCIAVAFHNLLHPCRAATLGHPHGQSCIPMETRLLDE